jgi:hypothetical protein
MGLLLLVAGASLTIIGFIMMFTGDFAPLLSGIGLIALSFVLPGVVRLFYQDKDED